MNQDRCKTILITGAGGFIGRRVVAAFKNDRVIACGFSSKSKIELHKDHFRESVDITKEEDLENLCRKYMPDVVIHCAGIAHQKINAISKADYFAVNSLATEHLAEYAIQSNPDVHFVFLSSISVYGEKHGNKFVNEQDTCLPSSDYAESKLDAEHRLKKLYEHGKLKKLDLLRLAPVYDRNWSINIEKRVYAPGKLFFLRFGSGRQRLSILSRENLVRFICFRVNTALNDELNNDEFSETLNICDEHPCTFNEIINVFQKSKLQPSRLSIRIPLSVVKMSAAIAGQLLKARSSWIASCYDKLAADLVFNNEKMLKTGFIPKDSVKSVFLNDGSDDAFLDKI